MRDGGADLPVTALAPPWLAEAVREGERRQHLSEGLGRASYLSPPSTCVQAAFSDDRGAAGVSLHRRRQTVSLTSGTNVHV